jgi:hypothetical protein
MTMEIKESLFGVILSVSFLLSRFLFSEVKNCFYFSTKKKIVFIFLTIKLGLEIFLKDQNESSLKKIENRET